MSATETSSLSDYAPVRRSALGPALNEQGYYVGRADAGPGPVGDHLLTPKSSALVVIDYQPPQFSGVRWIRI